jgi:hypothetical protein
MIQPAMLMSIQTEGQKGLSAVVGWRFTQRSAAVNPIACTVTQRAIKHHAMRSLKSISNSRWASKPSDDWVR